MKSKKVYAIDRAEIEKNPVRLYGNAKINVYPTGFVSGSISYEDVYRDYNYTDASACSKPRTKSEKPYFVQLEQRERTDNLRRAKQKIFDIVACNSWRYFVTFTLDQEEIDRTSIEEVTKKFKIWLNNMVKRRNLRYIFVFEYHKENPNGIHMHGLINDCDLDFEKAYHKNDDGSLKLDKRGRRIRILSKKSKKPVFNVLDWKYGYSTAIEVYGDPMALSAYISKYITKDSEKIAGNYYYAGGHGLIREPVTYVADVPYSFIMSSGIKMHQTIITNSLGEEVFTHYYSNFDNRSYQGNDSELCKYLLELGLIANTRRLEKYTLTEKELKQNEKRMHAFITQKNTI